MPAVHQMIVTAAPLAGPVLLDPDAALERACELIVDAATLGASLIVFPPGFIPGVPEWLWHLPPGDDATLNALLGVVRAGAVRVPGDVTDRLCRIACRSRIEVLIGVTECAEGTDGTRLFHTLLHIGAGGELRGIYHTGSLTDHPHDVPVGAWTVPGRERRRAVPGEIGVGGI